jgi:cobalt-zinc-cadmium efflux system protein
MVRFSVRKALTIGLSLSALILVLELAGGLVFHSTALVADALHIITDVLAISFSFVALTISARPPSDTSTYGFHRFEVIASLVNGLSLIGVVLVIVYEAIEGILHPMIIGIPGTIAFASIALILNLAASKILRNAQSSFPPHEDLNLTSAQMHLFGDALASAAVIIGAISVYLTGLRFIDPLVAIFIGLIVLRSAVQITMQGGVIILERSPIKDMQDLKQNLLEVKGVSDVHDFHAWRICTHITVASMHACIDSTSKARATEIRDALQNRLAQKGVQHVTIQLEDVCCVPSHQHVDG